MQRKIYLFLSFFIFTSAISSNDHLELLKLSNPNIQPQTESVSFFEDDTISFFLRPITFTQDGVAHYFKYTYNHDNYVDFLPYSLSHMIQFLEFGKTQEHPEQFAKSVIKLFLQKIKACSFINSYSLLEFLPQFADSMQPFLEKKQSSFLQELQISLKKKFTSVFSNYFPYFKKNPDAFLEALSEQIAHKTTAKQTEQHIDVEHLKKDILRFLEICINKLAWSPDDGYEAWACLNKFAEITFTFLEKKMITDIDAYDDICWSLVHRFCYFVELSHQQLPQEFFTKVITDLETKTLLLTEVEEQEDFMRSKKDHLIRFLKKYAPTETISKEHLQRLFETEKALSL